jgi:heat shock protein HtpX
MPMRQLVNVGAMIIVPFVILGMLVRGVDGMIAGAIIGVLLQAIAFMLTRPVILWMTRARVVSRDDEPELVAAVARLAGRAGIRTPAIAISNIRTPNAFAAATPGGGLVGVTCGLLEMLTPAEVEAVLAHEVAHLTHRDRAGVTVASIFAALPGAIISASGGDMFYDRPFRRRMNRAWGGRYLRPVRDGMAFVMLPFAAVLVRCAVSASDELRADAQACELIDDSRPLVFALRKIDALAGRVAAPLNPAISPMLLIHPFGPEGMSRWFNTHPPLAVRLAHIPAMSAGRD